MNNIPQAQMAPQQLQRLAAVRQIYANAKRVLIAQLVLGIICGFALVLLGLLYPSERVWGTLWGITFTGMDVLWLTPYQKKLRKSAATIQEMFDCDVLQLPFKKGKESVDPETVIKEAERYQKRPSSRPLENWYPREVGKLPLSVARVLCQRANCRWDAELRRRYINVLWLVVAVLIGGMTVWGVSTDVHVRIWLQVCVFPLMPVMVWSGRQIWENREAVDSLVRVKKESDKLWNESVAGTVDDAALAGKSRELQDEIWEQRAKNPLIFEWIYNWLQPADERHMNAAVAELIVQAQEQNPQLRD